MEMLAEWAFGEIVRYVLALCCGWLGFGRTGGARAMRMVPEVALNRAFGRGILRPKSGRKESYEGEL